ncbi:hypothetical protein BD414DRAFT_505651 [Trametes punicea]|nr:hypothetical protein BD414DRAFT_505651 [Trametes punicea]
MVSVLASNLVSAYIECAMYGIFLMLSFTSLLLLSRREKRAHDVGKSTARVGFWTNRPAFLLALLRSPLVAANILLMLTITAHWLITMYRFFVAVTQRETMQEATDYIADLSQGLEIARTALLLVDMILGDIVIVYRTWIVWKRDFRAIVVPCITIAGLVVTGSGILYQFKALGPNSGIFASNIGPWIVAECIATLCTNFYGTTMIAYKIYSLNHQSKRDGLYRAQGGSLLRTLKRAAAYQEALAIFVESAALYSVWTMLFVIFYLTHSPLQTMGSGCGPTLIGIAFTLITVRVGLGWGQESRSSGEAGGLPSLRAHVQFSPENSTPTGAIALDITRTVEHQVDYSLTSKSGHGAPHDVLAH